MFRTFVGLVTLLSLAACSHAAARKKVVFERVPDAEAAQVTNPHDFRGGTLCQRCHAAGETAPSVDPIKLCSGCHRADYMKHPYGVAQPTGAEGLPFMNGRIIACHTCHDPHDVKSHPHGLRLEYVDLCLKCHEGRFWR